MSKTKETTWAGVVARLLDHKGWTAYRLAKEAGLTQTGVIGLVKGRREPHGTTLQRMLAAAGVPWAWLDDVMEDPPKEPARK